MVQIIRMHSVMCFDPCFIKSVIGFAAQGVLMPDEEIVDVIEEVVQSTDSEQLSDRQEDIQEIQQRKRNDADYNWAEARRKMEQLERKSREQEEMIARLQKQPEPEDNLAEDDILTVSQARKLATKMAQEAIRQREAATVDERLKLKFSDYDQVVTTENIELLKQNDPELALSLQRLSDDPYSQSIAAYKLLKKSGYVVQNKAPTLEKKKALENSQKPISVNAVTKQSAIGNAHAFENGLTPDLKKQLWADMQKAMKG